MTTTVRFGGMFAPPLNPSTLSSYKSLASSCSDPKIKEFMLKLCDAVDAHHDEEDSDETPAPHPSGLGTITNLTKDSIKRMWDKVPWPEECDMYQKAFDELPLEAQDSENTRLIQEHKESGGKGLPTSFKPTIRSAAYHLLWYAKELAEDRQPLTNDKL